MAEADAGPMTTSGGNQTLVCHNPHGVISKGIWSGTNPLNFPTPLFLMQLSLISLTSLLIDLCLRPLGQCSIVSQIFGGIIFGPSLLGHKDIVGATLFPPRGTQVLETISTFGLMYYLFSVGVKMDGAAMVRPGRQAMVIGGSAMVMTFALTLALAVLLRNYLPMDPALAAALPLLAAAQCLTSFPNIACLLTELGVINTDLGRLAITSAMFCDAVGIAFTTTGFVVAQRSKEHPFQPVLALGSAVGLLVLVVYTARPVISWAVRRTPEGKAVGEGCIVAVFMAMLAAGFISEGIGQHYMFGPMVLGLVVPEGPPLGAALVEKLDYPISKVLYPTYLTASGLKTNIFKIHLRSLWIVGFIVVFASMVKIGAVVVPAYYNNKMPVQEAVVLGLMLNARGICELVLFNLWRETQAFKDEEFALAVLSVIGITAIITPLINYLYDPSKEHMPIRRRTLQHAKRDAELRIMVCIHNQDNIPSVVNILEASHATEETPVAVISVLLVELVGRTAPMLIAHQPQRALEQSSSRSGHIFNALKHYENHNQNCVKVHSFSSISDYQTMHDDICRVALDQNATIVIMPYHRQWAIDGSIGSMNRAIQAMNIKVLEKAPCSVGILIDRGVLKGSLSILNSQSAVYNVAVIYIGGVDDAESLSYGARMVQHRNVNLTVIRFLLFGGDNARERKIDNDLISKVRRSNLGNERFVYQEQVVRHSLDLSSSIGGVKDSFDLMIVGRHHPESLLLLGLQAWSECPELGVIGDIVASPDFGGTASVMVVQQQRMGGKLRGRLVKPVINDQDSVLNESLLQDGSRVGAVSTPASDNSTWSTDRLGSRV